MGDFRFGPAPGLRLSLWRRHCGGATGYDERVRLSSRDGHTKVSVARVHRQHGQHGQLNGPVRMRQAER